MLERSPLMNIDARGGLLARARARADTYHVINTIIHTNPFNLRLHCRETSRKNPSKSAIIPRIKGPEVRIARGKLDRESQRAQRDARDGPLPEIHRR